MPTRRAELMLVSYDFLLSLQDTLRLIAGREQTETRFLAGNSELGVIGAGKRISDDGIQVRQLAGRLPYPTRPP